MKRIASLISGIIIFTGLPLTGWGLGDIQGFIQNPYRLAYILIMSLLTVLVVIFVPNEGRSQGKGEKLVKKQKLSLLFLQILPVAIILLSPYCDHHQVAVFHESNSIRISGLLLTLAGFILMNWSVLALGKQFSINVTIQKNHQLITIGPYKYIRHPRYAGIIVFFGGVTLTFLSLISLIIVFFLFLVLIWRIKDEEKLMHEEFKEEWEEYTKKTFSLIPFVY